MMPEMVTIPEGYFLMGSVAGSDNEAPVHRVWVDAFAIAKYAVTRVDYAHFVKAADHEPPPYWDDPKFQDPKQPVVAVTWLDAVAYCAWLSKMTGQVFRLPTEAEREKASRGGPDGLAFPWGDELPEDCDGGRDTVLDVVGAGEPNGYGLFDMSGGVHEWCADYYDASYYAVSPERNPQGPEVGERRVARGGSWRHNIRYTRCAARSSLAPDKQFSDFGFRCARDE
ncbi:MAG: formylglycine-generating enzyme family protein [Candidatus Latescibacterota bacterium]